MKDAKITIPQGCAWTGRLSVLVFKIDLLQVLQSILCRYSRAVRGSSSCPLPVIGNYPGVEPDVLHNPKYRFTLTPLYLARARRERAVKRPTPTRHRFPFPPSSQVDSGGSLVHEMSVPLNPSSSASTTGDNYGTAPSSPLPPTSSYLQSDMPQPMASGPEINGEERTEAAMSNSGRNSARFETADAPTDGEALVGTTPPVPTHDPGASRSITPQETSPFEQSEKAEGYEGGIASGYSGGLANDELQPPRASYLLPSEGSSPRDSYHPPSSNTSTAGLGVSGKEAPPHGDDAGAYPTNDSLRRPFFRRPLVWLALVAAIIVIALAVVLPVVFVVVKPRQHNSNAAGEVPGTTGGGSDNPGSPTGATSGGNGSLIKTEDGSTFTYVNPFGGFCELPLAFGKRSSADERRAQGWRTRRTRSTTMRGRTRGRRL